MNQPHPQWQPSEKVCWLTLACAHELTDFQLELLTEVIRQSRIPPEILIAFINNNGIIPNWGDMLLPRGELRAPLEQLWHMRLTLA